MILTSVDDVSNPVKVVVFDSKGAQVAESSLQINWQNNPFKYDISTLLAGLYYVRIQSGGRKATFRVMKQWGVMPQLCIFAGS